MWKTWHMVQARALRGSPFIQPLHSRAKSSQTTHMAEAKMMMKNDFFISARYRLIRLLFTTDSSKNLSSNNLHFFRLGLSHSGWCIINSELGSGLTSTMWHCICTHTVNKHELKICHVIRIYIFCIIMVTLKWQYVIWAYTMQNILPRVTSLMAAEGTGCPAKPQALRGNSMSPVTFDWLSWYMLDFLKPANRAKMRRRSLFFFLWPLKLQYSERLL